VPRHPSVLAMPSCRQCRTAETGATFAAPLAAGIPVAEYRTALPPTTPHSAGGSAPGLTAAVNTTVASGISDPKPSAVGARRISSVGDTSLLRGQPIKDRPASLHSVAASLGFSELYFGALNFGAAAKALERSYLAMQHLCLLNTTSGNIDDEVRRESAP
jgi:hypothetical protein